MSALIDGADKLIERNHWIFSCEAARPRVVSSLQNWVNGNGCIAREETAYLEHSKELLTVASADDTVMTWLETFVEASLIRLRQFFGKVRHLQCIT